MTWKSAYAFVQGSGHQQGGVSCQDRSFSIMGEHLSVVSLADGAGSCKHSHIGAEVVTKLVCRILKKKFERLFSQDELIAKNDIHSELEKELAKRANLLTIHEEELASTLLFVAVKYNRYIAGHIGDGAIGILTEKGLDVLSHPERGEFANTTYFVTDPWALDHFRMYRGHLMGTYGFILMSDGACSSLYEYEKKVLNIESEKMLNWLKDNDEAVVRKALRRNIEEVLTRKTDDDCSICLLRLVENEVEISKAPDDQSTFPF